MAPKKRASKGISPMFYSIAGDICGGPYEFIPNNVFSVDEVTLFDKQRYIDTKRYSKYDSELKHEFTDDSVLSMAIARAVMESRDMDEYERVTVISNNLKKFCNQYPVIPGAYGPLFADWAANSKKRIVTEDPDVYKRQNKKNIFPSDGDGAAMRISSASQAFPTIEEGLAFSKNSADPSHGSDPGITSAQAIFLAGHLARAGRSKAEIQLILETRFNYNLHKSLDDIRKYNDSLKRVNSKGQKLKGNQCEHAYDVTQMALTVFLNSDNYVDAITKTISIGGDSDTIGSMVGGIAGAAWGMPRWMQKETEKRLDSFMLNEARDFDDFLEEEAEAIEPDKDEIEVALKKAELDKYILDQFKAGNKRLPLNDEKFLNGLADLEAAQMLYERIREARENKDDLTVQTLRENREALIASLREEIKNNLAFMEKSAEYLRELPVDVKKPARDGDLDQNKRDTNIPPLYARDVILVQNDKISGKIVDREDFKHLIDGKVESLRSEVEEKNKKIDEVMKQAEIRAKEMNTNRGFYNEKEDVFRDEKYYSNIIDSMKSFNDIYFSFPDKVPDALQSVLDDLEKVKKAQEIPEFVPGMKAVDCLKNFPTDDPDRLCENIQERLEKIARDMAENPSSLLGESVSTNQIAYVKNLADAVGKMREAPISEKEAYEYDASRLSNFGKKLDKARSSTKRDSSEYKLIMKLIKNLKDPKAEPYPNPKPNKENPDTPMETLSKKQKHVAKLYTIQSAINDYIEHKSVDGVNKNTYHKLAAVEELNQYITRRINELEPKSFVYLGKEIPKVVNKNVELSYSKDELKANFRDASKRNLETNSKEYKNSLKCMDRILGRAKTVKQKNSIAEMQNKFLKDPSANENIKVKPLINAEPEKTNIAAAPSA